MANNLKEVIKERYESWKTSKGLAPGNKPISFDDLYHSFLYEVAKAFPVSKQAFGRLLSKDFKRRQRHRKPGEVKRFERVYLVSGDV